MRNRFTRLLLLLALVWLLLAAFLAIQFWPDLPRSKLQWVLLIFFGPPLYIASEAFFTWLFSKHRGQSISSRSFSLKRILVALPIVLAFIAISWWLSWLLARSAT